MKKLNQCNHDHNVSFRGHSKMLEFEWIEGESVSLRILQLGYVFARDETELLKGEYQ